MDYIQWAVAFVLAVLWAVNFYMQRKRDKNYEKLIERNEKQDLKIQSLEDKIWDEDKLSKVVEASVEAGLTKWELKAIKSGLLHYHNEIKKSRQ